MVDTECATNERACRVVSAGGTGSAITSRAVAGRWRHRMADQACCRVMDLRDGTILRERMQRRSRMDWDALMTLR